MQEAQRAAKPQHHDVAVLVTVPAIIAILILSSWGLDHWEIGPHLLNAGLALSATVFGGWNRFIAGFRDLTRREITVNVFVAVALLATVAIGEFRAAAIIVLIMAVAGALESYTLDKNRRSIRSLLDLAPRTATIRRGDAEISIPALEVSRGDLVIVRPGDRISVDGVVALGTSNVNQAPITGESMPVEKIKGSRVYSGSLNEDGRLEIQAIRTGGDTALSRIVRLVEQAQGTRAPIQNVADRFTRWFLPTVLVLAMIGYLTSGEIKVAVSILLVACPCAFAIATPTAVTAGISNLARRSVLVKGGIFLERAANLDELLIDKTGTFTFGRPAVTRVMTFDGSSEEDVLRLAAIAEKYSEHPLARSVMALAGDRAIDVPDPDEFRAEAGRGVIAAIDGEEILVGKVDFLQDNGVTLGGPASHAISTQAERGKTVVLVARNGSLVGLVAVADEIRPETSRAIAALRDRGIQRITMLTGDRIEVARSVAEEIGVDGFEAELLPEQKQRYVKNLQECDHTVGMIGDGINDAPALAQADVGIAMGAAGTDVAIETADVTLMNDEIERVVDFIAMSKKVFTRIKLNIFFSIVYNAVGLILGCLGMLTPVLAVLFQEAGCITVVLSSTLLLWVRPISSPASNAEDQDDPYPYHPLEEPFKCQAPRPL